MRKQEKTQGLRSLHSVLSKELDIIKPNESNINKEEKQTIQKIMPYGIGDVCVICGGYCPEGYQVCSDCERKY